MIKFWNLKELFNYFFNKEIMDNVFFWLFVILFVIVLGAIILWAFNTYPSDATIIAREAQKYNVSKATFSAPDDVINQLLRSTLAQSADVPTGVYFEIVRLPKEFIIANIYTVSEITNVMEEEQIPVILNDPLEIYFNAVGMANARNIPFLYLFSLYSFGEELFLAASHNPIQSDINSISIYPWTSLQYSDLISRLGPQARHANFNLRNFL